jgi:hypothetical protein
MIWCSIFDDIYVKERILDPLVHHISNGMQLKQDLNCIIKYGMKIKKSNIGTTKPDPFLLTVPKERKIPTPTFLIKKFVEVF